MERGFRCLKDVLALRPIYHRTEPWVRAHLVVVNGHQTRLVTKPTPHAQAVLKAVGLPRLTPPDPCSEIA